MQLQGKDRIIYALDVDDLEKAKRQAADIAPRVGYLKVGLELLTRIGAPAAVALVREAGGKVMFDGKFHDIPNTMEGTAKAVAGLGAEMFTVHASAGRRSVRAAVCHSGESRVIGVTVLTSLDEEECVEIFGDRPSAKVRAFSKMLVDVGAHAVVCSPQEVASLADLPLTRITPGVRPGWAAAGDQKRIMTPHDAILAGADYLVIGRPIANPPAAIGSPAAAARLIADEIDAALERRAALAALKRAEDGDCGGC